MQVKTPIARKGALSLIAFDWSGVISDDRRPVYESNMRLLEIRGKSRYLFEEWLPRTQLSPIEFLANHGITGDRASLFDEYSTTLAKVRGEGINPVVYSDAKSSLRSLSGRGVSMVVISSHPEAHLIAEAEEYGVKGYFDLFVGSVRDKAAGILQVCSRNGNSPATVAYIGDTVYDIQAAKSAGVVSVGITSGYHVRERLASESPDILVDTLTQFKEVVMPLIRVGH